MMMRLQRMWAFAALMAVAPVAVAAQVVVNLPPGTSPKLVPTTASVTVSGAFAITPVAPALVQTTQQAGLCNPGFCATGSLTVQANSRWQLQVRLKPAAPTSFYVNWITPTPNQLHVRLGATTWYTIQSAATVSANTAVALRFNANKVTGNNSVVPTAAQLASYLEYRIIALP